MSAYGLSAMSSGQDQAEDRSRQQSGLVGGIFSKKEHDGVHVKFSDVDWATIVRAGGFLSHSEVCVLSVYSLRRVFPQDFAKRQQRE